MGLKEFLIINIDFSTFNPIIPLFQYSIIPGSSHIMSGTKSYINSDRYDQG